MQATGMQVVIFGTGKLARLASYVLTHDSPHEVVGFTVDGAYLEYRNLQRLPVVPFEEVARTFPPEETRMIVPLGWTNINGLRAEKQTAARAKGYSFISYVSSRANTWPDLDLGDNCMIFEGTVIEPFVRIGNGTIIRSGSHVSHNVAIDNYCFIAPCACIGGSSRIGERCFIGINSTIGPSIQLARRCVIGGGSVVMADTKENGVYMGVPAMRRAAPADRLTAGRSPNHRR